MKIHYIIEMSEEFNYILACGFKYKDSDNHSFNGSDMSKHTNWQSLRQEALRVYGEKCKECGTKEEYRKVKRNDMFGSDTEWDYSNFIVDHILPIALGGKEFDIKNLQILCFKCNKIKTKQDIKDIVQLRRNEKVLTNGQTTIKKGGLNSSQD